MLALGTDVVCGAIVHAKFGARFIVREIFRLRVPIRTLSVSGDAIAEVDLCDCGRIRRNTDVGNHTSCGRHMVSCIMIIFESWAAQLSDMYGCG